MHPKIRLFPGWYIVGVGFLASFVAPLGSAVSLSVLLVPMTETMGWSRTALSGAFSLWLLVGGIAAPFIGSVVDRWGPRLIMVIGAVVTGASLMWQANVHSLWQFYVIYGIVGSLGMACVGGIVPRTIVSKWFIRLRGRATAITNMGAFIGSSVTIVAVQRITESYGWRASWLFQGLLIWLLIIAPVAIFMKRQPEDVGLLPDGDGFASQTNHRPRPNAGFAASKIATTTINDEVTWMRSEALRTRSFWLVTIAFFLAQFSGMAVGFHRFAFLLGQELSGSSIAMAIFWGNLIGGVSSIGWGLVAERTNIRFLAALSLAGIGIASGLLLFTSSTSMLYVFALVWGIFATGNTLMQTLVYANYFGRAFAGSILGIATVFNLSAMAAGPVAAGIVYDVSHSYSLILYTCLAASLLAAAIMLLARWPKKIQV